MMLDNEGVATLASLCRHASMEQGRTTLTTYQTRMESPLGTIYLAGDDEGLQELTFANNRRAVGGRIEDAGPFRSVIQQLEAYFARALKKFDLPLNPQGTPFQKTVWEALKEIPYGETISYGELAQRIGCPKGHRAVGTANGRNPISIIVPCHRVIGSDGQLAGYGGGLANKERLLALEGALPLNRS
jgi:methylated-DNA-[protein]-cysteine S-methyltransferase